jgi:hypothetical protein
VDLRVVADALEQPVDDARGAPTATGDRGDRGRVDLDPQDLRRAPDDRGQLVVRVEVEPVRRAEAIPQRGADATRPGGGPHHREGLQAEPEAPGAGSLADHDVQCVVLHRRVEDLLHGPVQAMDLVDEQHVPLVQ